MPTLLQSAVAGLAVAAAVAMPAPADGLKTRSRRPASCEHPKNAEVTGYQTYDEIFGLLNSGEIDAFAQSRNQLDETFKKTVTAVAVPLGHNGALAFVTRFMTDATTNGTLRKAYDNNGLKDAPIQTE